MKRRLLTTLIILSAITAFGGCGSKGMERCSVSGTISVDGRPIDSGAITFHPKQGTASPVVGGVVEAGRFEILKKDGPAPGEYELEITGSRKTGNQIEVPGTGQTMDELEQAIPEKNAYPNGTEIPSATIKSGKNTLDIQLTSEG